MFKLELFKALIEQIRGSDKTARQIFIEKLLSMEGLITHSRDKGTSNVVLHHTEGFEYAHECITAQKLNKIGYNVVFMPKGYFKRNEKKFDVFLLTKNLLFESDLKCISSTNPDTIGNRIKEGSDQAPRLVLDITSSVQKRALIEGVKTGCTRNSLIKEILLFYRSDYYRLQVSQIMSRNIFKIIK